MPNGMLAQYGGAVGTAGINTFVRRTRPLFPATPALTNDMLVNLALVGTDLLGMQLIRQPMLKDFIRGGALFAAGSMTQQLLSMVIPTTTTTTTPPPATQALRGPIGAAMSYSVAPAYAPAPMMGSPTRGVRPMSALAF